MFDEPFQLTAAQKRNQRQGKPVRLGAAQKRETEARRQAKMTTPRKYRRRIERVTRRQATA